MESVRNEAITKRQTTMPAMPIYSPDDTSAPEILSMTGSFFAAAAIVVILRCYVRISMLRVFGIDDYLMVVALVCIVSYGSIATSMLISIRFLRQRFLRASSWKQTMDLESTSYYSSPIPSNSPTSATSFTSMRSSS